MSADVLGTASGTDSDGGEPPRRESFWFGVVTVARLELRQRVRSSRWVVVLVVWTALLALLTALIRWSVFRSYSVGDAPATDHGLTQARAGRMVFGIVVFLVLSLGALVTPALTSTTVNGDRAAGVLATLQTTLLSPIQLVTGKLAAAWAVALALLVCALPFILWAFFEGGTPAGRLVVVLVLLAVLLLVWGGPRRPPGRRPRHCSPT